MKEQLAIQKQQEAMRQAEQERLQKELKEREVKRKKEKEKEEKRKNVTNQLEMIKKTEFGQKIFVNIESVEVSFNVYPVVLIFCYAISLPNYRGNALCFVAISLCLMKLSLFYIAFNAM